MRLIYESKMCGGVASSSVFNMYFCTFYSLYNNVFLSVFSHVSAVSTARPGQALAPLAAARAKNIKQKSKAGKV